MDEAFEERARQLYIAIRSDVQCSKIRTLINPDTYRCNLTGN
jgi:hypothetical protein